MDLLVYSPLSFRYWGGFEKSFIRLLARLRELGIRSTIYCMDFLAGEAQRLAFEKVTSHLEQTDSTYIELKQTTLGRIPIPHASGLRELVRAVRDADVVYWNNAYALHDIIGSAVCHLGTPVISGYHAALFSAHFAHNQYVRWVTLPLAASFNASHVLNSDDARTLRRWKSKRVYLIPPGIDTTRFRPGVSPRGNSTAFKVLFVGRLVEQKGIGILAEVIRMAKTHGYGSKIQFTIAGSGPLAYLLNDIAEITSNVRLLGHVNEPFLQTLYDSSDLLIMPSLRETFGNVALEALACGLPVLAFSIAGLRDYITDGVEGILVNNKHADELFKSLEKVFVKWKERKEDFTLMREAARRQALRFDLTTTTSRFASMVREVSGEKSA